MKKPQIFCPRRPERDVPSGRPVPPPRTTKPITQKITVSPRTLLTKAIFKLKPISLNVAANEEIRWEAVAGDIKIRLNPYGSPFGGYTFRTGKGGACFSGVPRKDKIKDKPYRYTVLVRVGDIIVIGEGEVLVTSRAQNPTSKMTSKVKAVAPVKATAKAKPKRK